MRALITVLEPRTRVLRTWGPIAINAALLFAYALVLVRDVIRPDILAATDFTVFWSAWRLILDGRALAIYDEATQRATQTLLLNGGYFEGGLMSFLNPPHAALAGVPFGWLADRAGEQPAFIVWTVCNLGVLAIFIRWLLAEWGGTRRERTLVVLAVVSFYPVFCTVKNGQLSLLLAIAAFGVYRAEKARRDSAAGAWLTVLTIKPQLVPMVVIYLAARRRWRPIAAFAAIFAATVAATAIVLGPAIWIEYARNVHHLEQFWGTGTPDYMLNVRGALTRVFGLGAHAAIDAASYMVWLAGMAIAALVLLQRRIFDDEDARPAFAFAIALALLTNPHLFIHDTVLWAIPLVLYAASLRDRGAEWMPFAAFALAWPAIFQLASYLDLRSGPFAWFDLHTWTLVAATVMVSRSGWSAKASSCRAKASSCSAKASSCRAKASAERSSIQPSAAASAALS